MVLSVCFPALCGLAGTYGAVHLFSAYGWALFLGLPILVSFLSAFFYRKTGPASWGKSYGISLLAILLLGGLILIFAIDGLICLLMALPLASFLALIGSVLGYLLAQKFSKGPAAILPLILILLFPFLTAFEAGHPADPRIHRVATRLSIRAPIEDVWHQVVAFDRIEAPVTGIFRMGIAYPVQARIEGQGIGAVRYCIFSTGPFIEPITRWSPPNALEFSVASNPPPMKEFSPWGHIETPHLDHTFTSTKGQFKLWEENGKTVLEGTTWYYQTIAPDWYWHALSDQIIHKIHLRVLEHIRVKSETGG